MRGHFYCNVYHQILPLASVMGMPETPFAKNKAASFRSAAAPLCVTARDGNLMNRTCLLFLLAETANDKRLLLVATCHVFCLGYGGCGCQTLRKETNLSGTLTKNNNNKKKKKKRKDEELMQGRRTYVESGSCPGGRSMDKKREG